MSLTAQVTGKLPPDPEQRTDGKTFSRKYAHARGSTGSAMESLVDPQADLRRQFVAACKKLRDARAVGLLPGDRDWPGASLQRFAALRCGARTKGSGQPCRLKAIYWSGRCKFHGGLSSGPKSPEGKARSALNGRCPKRSP